MLSKIVNLLFPLAGSGDKTVARSLWNSSRRWKRKITLSKRNKEAREAKVKAMWKGPQATGEIEKSGKK